jgi:hypothetical protein
LKQLFITSLSPLQKNSDRREQNGRKAIPFRTSPRFLYNPYSKTSVLKKNQAAAKAAATNGEGRPITGAPLS